MENVVIIGNGIAGVTAARHIRKQTDKEITLISSESEHFFSRTALMYVYMGHMQWEHLKPYEDWFWKKNKIALKQGYVNRIDTDTKTLLFESGEKIVYDILIIASGSHTATYGWKGQELKGVQGLVTKQDLELLAQNAPNKEICKSAVIIGGGLIGVELAEMLHTREIQVTFLIREHTFWANVLPDQDAALITAHLKSHGIDLRFNTQLAAIEGDENGRVKALITDTGETISCQLVGLATGVKPNIAFLKDSGIETDKGILVNQKLETNIKNIYAIGDCAQHKTPQSGRKAIESIWYTGRMMGETVAQTICGKPFDYKPGHWFNSAKFFDIEYQTYGNVSNTKNKPENEVHFHWKHPKEAQAITIAFDQNSRIFKGINTLGIRMRHYVFDRWLTEKRTVDFVVSQLQEANFDPEFYKRHEKAIQQAYQQYCIQKA